MNHAEFAQGLRIAAAFIESHPELPCPTSFRGDVWGCTKEQMALAVHAAGKVNKGFTEELVWVSVDLGPAMTLDYNAYRSEVCERVQVGTKIEPAHIIPAQPEQVVAEREVAVYEWRCAPIMQTAEGVQ